MLLLPSPILPYLPPASTGAAAAVLGGVQILKADEKMSERFSKLAAELLEPIAAKVGWEPKDSDGHSGKLLRATVIELLAT